jgi:hypothetical protein
VCPVGGGCRGGVEFAAEVRPGSPSETGDQIIDPSGGALCELRESVFSGYQSVFGRTKHAIGANSGRSSLLQTV